MIGFYNDKNKFKLKIKQIDLEKECTLVVIKDF